ncbi:MAG: hypothetical protein ACRBM6_01920 [Geminicoccales bacterium]
MAKPMIAHAIEFLFVAGVREAEPISALCHAADMPHILLDLPGEKAPSVISDNYGGAIDLVNALLGEGPNANGKNRRERAYFIDGDTPTAERTMDPARTNIESLTTTPGIREQPRSEPDL